MAEAKLIGRPARWHQPRSVGTCRSAMSQLDLFWFYAKEAMLAACDTESDEDKRQLTNLVSGGAIGATVPANAFGTAAKTTGSDNMDATTLLIIVIIVLLLGGGVGTAEGVGINTA